ncbi:MAG: 2'-5' RNA ligase family protein, partial [Candidatus Micrarchaeota archaeon]|nr:2'-5' RNA ligase family protein [Candidatus Micrarchaeota archaeon]
ALSNKVRALMRRLKSQYSVSQALYDAKGPHITILYSGEPVWEKDSLVKLREICSEYRKMTLQIDGIGYFMKKYGRSRNYVIYLKINKSKRLVGLHRQILISFEKRKPTGVPFHPHLTLARSDLNKKKFYSILKEYRNLDFRAEIDVRFLTLCIWEGRGKPRRWKFIRLWLGKSTSTN